ncbi:hemoglobin/transferrin/lactoferrin receptor protein [Gemmobacter megaterium]|uniref:Hemoglobin/transferrin/lactoferrin receptor protein n=1 Tax=Gemmobacter megaterium TaxID=1086013 RepID=A0A1N7NET4_9RHOB|nr:TonB-dependent hemoglobin/transferrin/lactoferrin family receptor [Gemmobacter megaterium]SIS96689.1 hemoglobin/transferrin/lactoferrin receptor protein [Gemmobacter megaterium]
MRHGVMTTAALRATTALVLLSGSAWAQETRPTDEKEVRLDPVTILADRQGTPVTDVPAAVTVVTGAEIEARGLTDIKQLTRYTPGITVNRQVNADPFSTFGGFTIRGVSGNRVQMLVDGSRMAERITDGTRDYMDLNFTKQVEMVKGPASVLWGADALGGVVAVQTLDPEDVLQGRDRAGTARLSFDGVSDKTGVQAMFAQRFGSQFATMIGIARDTGHEQEYSKARADGGIYGCGRQVALGAIGCNRLNPADITANRLLAKAVWTPSDAHRLEFSVDMLKRETKVRNLTVIGLTTSGSETTTGDVVQTWDRTLVQKRQRYAVEHTWTPGAGVIDELRTTLAFTPHVYDQSGKRRVRNAATGAEKIIEDYRKFTEDFLELDIQATSRATTGAAEHLITWGFDGDYAKTDFQRRDVTRDLTSGTVTESRAGGFNFANASTRRADLYIQDRISLMGGALEITPGLRYATYRMSPRPDGDYAAVPGSEPVVRSKAQVLKSLGTLYRFGNGWQVWGHYGEGFKMPTAEQLYVSNPSFNLIPNPDLVPEEVKSLELGVRREWGRGMVGVTAFQADYTDFIASFQPVTLPGGATGYTYRNLSSVKIHGVELEGYYDLSDNLRLNGSASWQRGTQVANPGAAKTPYTVAPLMGTLGLSWQVPDRPLTLDVVGTFASKVTRGTAGNFRPAGYGVVDVYARWDVAENAVLNVGVRNLFDKRYFDASAANYSGTSTTATSVITPLELQTGAGRSFNVSLDLKF